MFSVYRNCFKYNTIHMPQRTSKILLIRLTAKKTRCYFKYALRVSLVTLCGLALRLMITIHKTTTLHSLQLRIFPLHTRMKALFGVKFTHGVYQSTFL